MTFWKTPEFKALQRAWYERLKAEGFQDVEVMIADDMVPIHTQPPADILYRTSDSLTRESTAAYYRFISHMVQETVFRNAVDRLILASHAEGKGAKAIVDELGAAGVKRSRNTIRYKIRSYEMRWGLRIYTPRQLNKKVS